MNRLAALALIFTVCCYFTSSTEVRSPASFYSNQTSETGTAPSADTSPTFETTDSLSECDVLDDSSPTKPTYNSLHRCFSAILLQTIKKMEKPECNFSESTRRALIKNITKDAYSDQLVTCNEAFKQALLCNLNLNEQKFIAAIIVTWGEARGASVPYFVEYNGIRQVLENRTRLLNEYFPGKNYNILHAALQGNQFSLFNADDSNWLLALDPQGTTSEYYEKSIRAFQDYQSADCQPKEVCDSIVSYHARWMPQSTVVWAQDNQGPLNRAYFSFDGVSNQNASRDPNFVLDKSEQKRRHWFYSVKTKENRGVDLDALYTRFPIYQCEQPGHLRHSDLASGHREYFL